MNDLIDTRPGVLSRLSQFVIALVAADLMTKALFFIVLPYRQVVPLLGGALNLYVVLNDSGFDYGIGVITSENHVYQIGRALANVFVGIYAIVVRRLHLHTSLKILAGLFAYMILEVAVQVTCSCIQVNRLPDRLGGVIAGSSSVFFAGVLFAISTGWRLRFLLSFLLAGAIGNTLSMLSPWPGGVVDFFYIKFRPNLTTEVLNLADLYQILVLVIATVFAMLWAFSNTRHVLGRVAVRSAHSS